MNECRVGTDVEDDVFLREKHTEGKGWRNIHER